jgi:hypothetical protein
VALVDNEDFERVSQFKWFAVVSKNGRYVYAASKQNYKLVYLHKFLLNTEFLVDHINGNTLDNRRSNLRIADKRLNSVNKEILYGKVHSRFKGVTIHRGRFVAAIQPHKMYIHLGTFDDEIKAAEAYDDAAREIYGEFARTNF